MLAHHLVGLGPGNMDLRHAAEVESALEQDDARGAQALALHSGNREFPGTKTDGHVNGSANFDRGARRRQLPDDLVRLPVDWLDDARICAFTRGLL